MWSEFIFCYILILNTPFMLGFIIWNHKEQYTPSKAGSETPPQNGTTAGVPLILCMYLCM